jgi:hypothetical protein
MQHHTTALGPLLKLMDTGEGFALVAAQGVDLIEDDGSLQ